MRKETKAISTLLVILLMLIAAIVGALIAYMWTMAPFYLEPQDTVDLIVTDVNFPVGNANQFNVTVMNPSHSISGTNITSIYLTAAGFSSTSVIASDPALPIRVDKGTSQTIVCSLQWGSMAGSIITVHVVTASDVEVARLVQTQSAGLQVDANFDPSQSVEYFNVSVKNSVSPINLTLSHVLLDMTPVDENLSVPLTVVIPMNQTVTFTCFVNWEGRVKPLVTVQTLEGYTAEVRKDIVSSVNLQVTQVIFNQTNTSETDVTLFNSPDSATSVTVTNITLTRGSTVDVISGSLSTPALPQEVGKNQTVTFACAWNWTDISYRDKDVTVVAHTKQGFASQTQTARTPPGVAGEINDVRFDLDDTGLFLINITNKLYSLHAINVTEVDLNQNLTSITPTLIDPGAQSTLTCSFNWSSFVGQNVTVTAHFTYDSSESLLTYNLTLPYLKISNASFFYLSPGSPYVNITVYNSAFSKVNATVTRVYAETENGTVMISGAAGQEVPVGTAVEILCPLEWPQYIGQNVTIIVQTADGNQASATFTDIPFVSLQVTQVTFNETNTNEAYVTLFNSPDSATSVSVTNITLAHGSAVDVISGNLSNPALPIEIDKNQTVTFACAWNWTDISYRDMNLRVTAYTQQGFVSQTLTVTTPPRVAARIDSVLFDLNDTSFFLVNVTNMPYSLYTVNVTRVDLNQNQTSTTATLIAAGGQSVLTCSLDWSSFVGQNVTVTAYVTYDTDELLLTCNLTLPYVRITNASFFYLSPGSPYVNITVHNSDFSKINATITRVYVETENGTVLISDAAGQEVPIGTDVEMLCPWDWSPYVGQNVTIIVQTSDGNQASATFTVG